ncbi:MAG: hypothetical protein ACOY99_06655 [Pseudomonadota bacterium]
MAQPARSMALDRPADPVPATHRFGARLRAFDTPGASAFAHGEDDGLIVLVHRRHVPLRKHVADLLGQLRPNALLRLVEQQILALDGEERLVSLLERPQGGPLVGEEGARASAVSERDLRNLVLPQLLNSLCCLHEYGLTHRALHPSRLYYRNGERTDIVIGECFSAPPGTAQPIAFETIARAMADPMGRGEGAPADDFYALGALLMSLLLGRDLATGRTPEQLLAAKVTQGSYAALCGGVELPGAIGMLLRGLLTDSPEDRWKAADVLAWLEGSSVRVHSAPNHWALSRPVGLGGRSFTDRRQLAQAMSADVATASAYIRRHDIAHWISHFLPRTSSNQELVNLVHAGDARRRGDVKLNTPDHLVARFCALLDPMGPIRFRGVAVMPDGLGPLFAQALDMGMKGDLAEALKGISESNFAHGLSNTRSYACPETQRESQGRAMLAPGMLLDRGDDDEAVFKIVYGLNPGLPCLSPQFERFWVDGPGEAVKRLDGLMMDGHGATMTDPQLLAFILAHTRDAAARFAGKSLSARPAHMQAADLLHLFGMLQAKHGLGPLRGLTKAFAARLKPEIGKLRSKTRRAAALNRLEAIVNAGALSQLAELFDMGRLLAADDSGWRRARQRMRMIDLALRRMAKPVSADDPRARESGAQGAAAVGFAVLILVLMMEFV